MSATHGRDGDRSAVVEAALRAVREARAEVESLRLGRHEPIAIVGIGCRFPGGADSPERFWQLLLDGVDTVTPVPASRWPNEDYYDADPSAAGRMSFRQGAFIEDVDRFDPYFFGIAPTEAARMDPQQRLFLEAAWEALEDAGQTQPGLRGSATGVFVGANSADYLQLQLQEPHRINTHTIMGGTGSAIANRLSYLLDLQGPSMVVDTACSSSLVAVHLACQSLRQHESDLAVAGGVHLVLSPITTMAHAKGLPLAPDGRCKTFDASADGYTRGEGVGAIVCKRLSDAQADGDRIWAVIRGTAVNQDGRTNGLTAPSGWSQKAVIAQALRNARMTASDVTLIEAHGTGTALGDPIEVEALAETYGSADGGGTPCSLGSVKTNIGHLEPAAGIAGLIKAALSIHHRTIAPTLHLRTLNPLMSLDGTRFLIPTRTRPWEAPDAQRNAAVSSFGAGGTNAHAVLGPAPVRPPAQAEPKPGPHLIPLSAATREALAPMAAAYRDHLRSPRATATPLGDIAHTATARRTQHRHRLAVVAESPAQAADRLDGWLAGEAPAGVVAGKVSGSVGRKVVFVFPGQGAQRATMGRELMRDCAVFREAVTECDRALHKWLGRSVLDELALLDGNTPLERIDLVQPALFALGVGLAARARSFGIEPDAVVGHSMGEVAAAHVAGALSLDDAARVISLRSTLLRRVSGQGAMLVVGLAPDDAEALIADERDRVSVAVCNSPASTVLSGEPRTLERLAARVRERNVFCKPVRVDVASHSPQVESLRADLMEALDGLSPVPSATPIYSTARGRMSDGSEFDAAYWMDNLRQPVRFWDGVRELIGTGHGVFVEISPHPTLLSAVEQGFDAAGCEGLALPAMRRGEPESHAVYEILGALHTRGLPVDLRSLLDSAPAVELPRYAWQRERFWYRQPDAEPVPRAPAPAAPAARPGPRTAPTAEGALAGPATAERPPAQPPKRRQAAGAAAGGGLRGRVLEAVAAVLGSRPDRIDPEDGFFQLGMDSSMATQARARLEAALGISLPATLLFEYPTVDDLSAHLEGLAGGAAARPAPEPAVQPSASARIERPQEPSDIRAEADEELDLLDGDTLLGLLIQELTTPRSSEGS
ncbi:polyketide synthase [Streptomyces sulfonofaciens]|uniref:Polyketide synthase n=1 Tax=Streptomyces sulfonofaciens TaxID=68272 RepID=A0A919GF90_9ACTN|nr:type I polyketide synthase [Streptomyces sulfonofaciens]GHH83872.1 polyketide synthase [Streptomyces sulfonofaciens]